MNIEFNKVPGEIFDIFSSLYIINNREADKKELSEISFKRNDKIEESIDLIIENKKVNLDNFQLFFHKDVYYLNDVFRLQDIWNFNDLNSYLNFMKNIDVDEMRNILAPTIHNELEKSHGEDYSIEKITLNNETFLKYIRRKNLNPEIKWEIYSILNHKDDYMSDFINFINDYIEIYKDIEIIRKPEMDSFNEYMQHKLETEGLNYLTEVNSNSIDFNKYDNIYVSTCALSGIIINVPIETNDCYIIIGSAMKEGLKIVSGKDEIESNLSVYKSLSDSTRFSIIKLLLKKDYYGLELAEALQISNATIAYHINFLSVSGIIIIKKKDHRSYCSLNKDKIRQSIKFLYGELEL